VQKRSSIANAPLLAGIALSMAIHLAMLNSKGIHTPATPRLETGRTVVQLTLAPSIASQTAPPEPTEAPPAPPDSTSETPLPEPVPLPEPTPNPEPASAPPPEPQPVVEKKPVHSQEQIASLAEDKGIQTDAQPIEGITATYPRTSQRRGEEGTVLLSIEVLANGKAGLIEVVPLKPRRTPNTSLPNNLGATSPRNWYNRWNSNSPGMTHD
jgi:protein TonB